MRWTQLQSGNWFVAMIFVAIICLLIWQSRPSGAVRLIVAAQTDHPEAMERLLEDGVSPDATNGKNSALIAAIRAGHLGVTQMLLSHGANVDFDAGSGFNPLTWAIRGGNPDLVKLLLHSGANPGQKNADGRTAIDEARNSPELLQLLLPSKKP